MSTQQQSTSRVAGAGVISSSNWNTQQLVGKPYHLDWRMAPTPDEILERLWKIQAAVDEQGQADIVISSSLNGRQYARKRSGDEEMSKVKRGSQLELFDVTGKIVSDGAVGDNVHRGWVYHLRTCVKLFDSARDSQYLLKFGRVAKKAALIVDKAEPERRRGAGYDMDAEVFPKNEALCIFQDLALTIGVHPTALGIYSASTGEYVVPNGYVLRLNICKNVFEYNGNRISRPNAGLSVVTRSGTCHIDNMIHSLEIQYDRTFHEEHKIRAVIVIEHRNLADMMQRLTANDTPDWSGLFFVLTGGFPALSTREFLHMLGKDPKLDDVPFLFVSDHDPHAMEIYSTLKHGSRKNAYATLTTICPRLQWAGATIHFYERMARSWPANETERRIRDGVLPASEREKLIKKLELDVTKKMLDRLTRGRGILNAPDKMRLKHFFNYEIFSEKYDPILYSDLQEMGMNKLDAKTAIKDNPEGKKFPLAALANPNVYGIQECFLYILREWGVNGAVNSQFQLPQLLPEREHFLQGLANSWQPRAGPSQLNTSSQRDAESQAETQELSSEINAEDLQFGTELLT